MKKHVLILVFFIVLTSCAYHIKVQRYTETVYPASSNVEVMRTAPPQRGYMEIAQLETSSSDKEAIINLKKRAGELGADAIIILGEEYRGSVLVTNVSVPINMICVVAIKYTKK